MVSAAAIFALRGLPLVKVYDIGVFEHVAGAHVDTLVGGGRALSLIRFLFLRTFLLQSRGDGRVRRSICLNHFHSSPTRGPSRSCDIRSAAILSAHRHEFGLLRNRPDASLLLRARWIAQTRRRLGTANGRRNHHDLRDQEAHRRHKRARCC
jgi:hypothetical protein